MRLRLASRKSDLARWQAVQVARAFERLPERPSIEFLFKSSLGDQNLDLPLASMGSKGVFTEDFYEDLAQGRCDLVVHSWKDLPTEERAGTLIAMTLARADVRDVVVVPETVWAETVRTGRLKILTSSPRRIYNLSTALPRLLPAGVTLDFAPVRGNVPTRLSKMHEEGAALILAKAGLDRLLEAEDGKFGEVALRAKLKECRFQVLPVSLNPPAPAQGALAIEIARGNARLQEMAASLNQAGDFACVAREREILRSHGGGCHQKIGVAILERPYGLIHALRGVTDAGEILSAWTLANATPWTRAARPEAIFPRAPSENGWFDRVALPPPVDLATKQALFIARAEALPGAYTPHARQAVWTSGVKSWEALAKRGVWVNGCSDGLGETEDPRLETMLGPLRWTKLTHQTAGGAMDTVATYALRPKKDAPDLTNKTHFYWMSRTSFERAYELYPEVISRGFNACGPGVTFEFLQRRTGLAHPVKVFIGLEQFLGETRP